MGRKILFVNINGLCSREITFSDMKHINGWQRQSQLGTVLEIITPPSLSTMLSACQRVLIPFLSMGISSLTSCRR